MTWHTIRIVFVRSQQATMLTARLSSRTLLEAEIALAPGDWSLVMKLAKLNQDITQADFEAAQDVPVELNDQKQISYSNECRNHSRRISMLETHRGQAYSLILGVHSAAPGQDEAGCILDHGQHVLQPTQALQADQAGGPQANQEPISFCHDARAKPCRAEYQAGWLDKHAVVQVF
jgi:hypothetical protein